MALPVISEQRALNFDYFPTRYQALIFRNWNIVAPERLAAVLETAVETVVSAAAALGLPAAAADFKLMNQRNYVSIIRRNWHLLDYEGLCRLLDWDAEKLEFTLREDDFLFTKLGRIKPATPPCRYHALNARGQAATAEIAATVRAELAALPVERETPFAFLNKPRTARTTQAATPAATELRMIYGYSVLYGDPLAPDAPEIFPDELLAEYAGCGINAVWMPALLYKLIPWLGTTPAAEADGRLERLNRLIARASKYHMAVFLYLNEPRGVPDETAATLPQDWRGARHNKLTALCTHSDSMLHALSDAVRMLCAAAPGLGGLVSITQGENLVHCLAKGAHPHEPCARCAADSPDVGIVKILNAIHQGMKDARFGGRLIAWSWAWQSPWAEKIIAQLPKEIIIQCVSEWGLPSETGGIHGTVRDYSISHPGPSPESLRRWRLAAETGHRTMAKLQINTTWECPMLPYLPTPDLVAEHLNGIRRAGVENFMLSWTLGGYPGGNIELLSMTPDELARQRFGAELGAAVRAAERKFAAGFRMLPLADTGLIYYGPQGMGPANPLYLEPTGYPATMVGLPYDDLNTWRGIFPAAVMEDSFRMLSEKLAEGLEILDGAATRTMPTESQAENLRDLRSVAEGFYLSMRSTYLQICFIRRRNEKKFADLPAIAAEEETLARRLLHCQARDSRIGFEATNHYMFLANDMLEKILNTRMIRSQLQRPPYSAES